MSLASTLVMWVKSRRFSLNVAASASAALLRLASSGSTRRLQRRLERQRLALDVEAQAGERLVEQPVPRAAPGDRLLVEEPLDPVFELVGPLQPQILDPRPVDGRAPASASAFSSSASSSRFSSSPKNRRCVEIVGQPVLQVAVELRARRIGGVAGVDEPGEAAEPAEDLLDPLVFGDRLGKPARRHRPLRRVA